MKQFFAVLILLFSTSLFAQENYWPRSFYVRAGMGVTVSKGDFNEGVYTVEDTNGVIGLLHTPAYDFLGAPDIALGVNIRSFSLELNFQYWKSTEILAGYPTEEFQDESSMWRLGFEFTYNLFWPEYFQVGFGLGYSYSSVHTLRNVDYGNRMENSYLMGSAIALIANIHYYMTDNLSIVPTLKLYEAWFKGINTKSSGTLNFDPFLWQTFVSAGVSLKFQF